MTECGARRAMVAVIPVAVPLTMSAVFVGLRRLLPARTAYNVGFLGYWLGWCVAVPLWLLGPRTAARLLITGRRLPGHHVALLAAPVAGALVTQLVPHRREIDVSIAATMVGTAVVNAVGEELLWRGVFVSERAHRPALLAWSLIGFSLWHLAPQLILPSPLGRGRFVAGSALVGLVSTLAAQKSGGLRQVIVAHTLTDACGVTAARFRLGR